MKNQVDNNAGFTRVERTPPVSTSQMDFPYPCVNLLFEPKGVTLNGELDTGSSMTFISYEWLVENGFIKKSLFSQAVVNIGGHNATFRFVNTKLSARLEGGGNRTDEATISIMAVQNWNASQFSRNGSRLALIGRDVLRTFHANVEIDGETGAARVTTQNWETFEHEVANLYRHLGLEVKKDYNLAGNQIDIFLSEKTSSGKVLRTIVECKFHKKPVGVQYIRQLVGILEFARSNKLADHAVLVSSSGFSKDARLVAKTANIDLFEIDDLRARAAKKTENSNFIEPPNIKERKPKQKSAFIIMPFRDDYRDIYMLGIRETLAKHGYVCRRADEVEFNGRIMDQILDLIGTSDVIVAEVSEPNPNVYYELGISHATGKNVVLCTKDMGQVPFDTRDLITSSTQISSIYERDCQIVSVLLLFRVEK